MVRPSASLVPADDPTLLFVNAGMVPFKKVFLGMEEPPDGKRRATTAQKCVRAGGKHNDLEQVGHTARHQTFFEMLGNFSFGDYFKRDAIRFAWEFVTRELEIDPSLLRVTVHHSDDEAFALWQEIAGLPASRIYRLGDKDNFWQMADTGPCGPCTEIFVDISKLAADFRFPDGATGEWTDLTRAEFSHDAFVEGSEAGRFLEFWNLVFMQFDRQADGQLVPLPKPSVDTGAGLERIAGVKQGVMNNFHTDVFAPLIKTVEEVVGFSYWGRESNEPRSGVRITGRGRNEVIPNEVDPAGFRVLADHARAVAFLLADGVFPSNEGRGYVLRRILRRAVRHAYLMGRREPTLVEVVRTVIDTMGDAYPELRSRSEHLLQTTRVEEQAFLATIEGGLSRFEQLAPAHATDKGTISGEDAFRLYDTFGFPIDLTELMARERGYTVDIAEFDAALLQQRTRSKDERKTRKLGVEADALGEIGTWDRPASTGKVDSRFVGYDTLEICTDVAALRRLDGNRVAILLCESPFYAESGGQLADEGEIVGDGWRVDVDGVKKVEGRSAALGRLTGDFKWSSVVARVPSDRRRDTERNHTATHLLHSALRRALGEAVHQAGSLVAPDRLRFDFTHHGPVPPDKLEAVEADVNREIWRALPVSWSEMAYPEARALGAMALFGEKYGDVVRVVDVHGVSKELCGGTHVRNTSEIGLFVVISETGVASGVRRIEALTGPGAYSHLRDRESALVRIAELLRTPLTSVEKRVQHVLEERRVLEKKVEEAARSGGSELQNLIASAQSIGENGAKLVIGEVAAADTKALQAMGDALREQMQSGVGLLAARLEDGRGSLLVVVTDDLRARGLRADAIVRDVAALAGGKGGGKPHMAQAGIPDASRMAAALAEAPRLMSQLLASGS